MIEYKFNINTVPSFRLTGILLMLFIAGATYVFAGTAGPVITSTPYATNIMGSGAQIVWTTDDASDGWVMYGTTANNLSQYATYRCDSGGNVTSHCINLMNLSASTPYYFQVVSSNTTGSTTASGSFTSASGGSIAPDSPTGFTSGTPSSTSIPLSWNASLNADKYNIYREVAGSASWSFVAQVTTGTSYTDSGLSPATTYNYHIDACRSGYGCSSPVYLNNVTTASALDTTAPSTPTNFSAVLYSSTESRLTWGMSTDNVGVTGYKIFRNSTLVTTITTSGTYAYTDGPLAAGTYYSYVVKAIDAAGNESAGAYATVMVPAATTTTATIPSAPTNLHVVTGATALSLQWTDNATNEDKWNVERKHSTETSYTLLVQIASANTTTHTDTSAGQGVLYDYRVQACLSGVGCSAYATISGVSFGSTQLTDTEKPIAPTTMSATALSPSQITISWSGATDNVGVVGYKLYRNGSYYIGITGMSYTDSNVTPDTLYTYAVKAVDATGNESLTSTTREVRTPAASVTATTSTTSTADTIPPTPPYDYSYTLASTTVSFSFTGAADNVGVAAYKIFRNGVYLKTVQEPYCVDTGLTPNTTYSYYVKAIDTAGNESEPTKAISVTTLASSAPTPYATTSPTIVPTTTVKLYPVSISVLRGTSFCEGSIGKTKMIFSANPASGAHFRVARSGGSDVGTIAPGTYDLLNGTYSWEAVANSGFVLDHIARDQFVLNKLCETTITPPPPPPPPPATVSTAPNTTESLAPEPSPNEIQPNTETLVVSAPSTIVPSVTAVATAEQYANYCDDPAHRTLCEAYAVEKVTTRESTPITTPIVANAPIAVDPTIIEEDAQILSMRTGVRMFQDSDGDEITDYDEVNIYFTDPEKADTNKDGIKDGDHLLAGSNPLAEASAPIMAITQTTTATSTRIVSPTATTRDIVYENPKVVGEAKPQLLAVTGATGVVEKNSESGATTTKIVLSGKALPNSFVTLYIFSDPIVVRVKADASGAWVYTLDQELPDGSHEVVSAITDTGGRILAKSEPAPFVKVAAAVSFGSPELLPAQSAPSFFSGTYFYLIVALFIILVFGAFVAIGMVVKQKGALPIRDNNETKF